MRRVQDTVSRALTSRERREGSGMATSGTDSETMDVVQNPGRLSEQVKRNNEYPLPGGEQPSRSRRLLLR